MGSLLLWSSHVHAAEITRVASSFESARPFNMYLDLQYERKMNRSRLVRELHVDGKTEDVTELWFSSEQDQLNTRLHIGLWRDLEFRYVLPVVFQQDRRWAFVSGTDESNSTITNNCVALNGDIVNADCPFNRTGAVPLFDVPARARRAGLDNMTFGLSYAIFNQKKDATKPTWTLEFDYTAPTATVLNPSIQTSVSRPGALGDGIHRYRWATTFSRRMGIAEPYVQFSYTLPWRGPATYSNCDDREQNLLSTPENCGQEGWKRATTGILPPHLAGMQFGTEVNLLDDETRQTKLAFDVRGTAQYVSEGRYYNEMSDLFGKLLFSAEHLQLGGQFGLVAHLASFLQMRANGSVQYNTDHFVTNETIGRDLNGNGTIDLTGLPAEVNPNFDWRVDMVSRRFRTSDSLSFRLDFTTTVVF